jgi:hypothetical protein
MSGAGRVRAADSPGVADQAFRAGFFALFSISRKIISSPKS